MDTTEMEPKRKCLGEEMREIIEKHISSWKNASYKTEETIGWTNHVKIAYIEDPSVKPQKIILRKFGGNPGFLDRQKENQVLNGLSKLRLGPQMYYSCERYRLEEFLEGTIPNKSWYDNEVYCSQVAASLAQLHRIPFKVFFEDGTTHTGRVLSEWVQKGRENLKHKERFKESNAEMLRNAEELLSAENISFIQSLMRELEEDPKNKVLSHTDTYYLNHIVGENGKVNLIDFEYVMPNPMMYDIANFFNEYNIDYKGVYCYVDAENRMTKSRIHKMIKSYMAFSAILENEPLESIADVVFPKELIESEESVEKFLSSSVPDWEKKFERFCYELMICTILINFNWSNWGIMFASNSNSEEFDYAHYANERMKYYFLLKKELAALKGTVEGETGLSS